MPIHEDDDKFSTIEERLALDMEDFLPKPEVHTPHAEEPHAPARKHNYFRTCGWLMAAIMAVLVFDHYHHPRKGRSAASSLTYATFTQLDACASQSNIIDDTHVLEQKACLDNQVISASAATTGQPITIVVPIADIAFLYEGQDQVIITGATGDTAMNNTNSLQKWWFTCGAGGVGNLCTSNTLTLYQNFNPATLALSTQPTSTGPYTANSGRAQFRFYKPPDATASPANSIFTRWELGLVTMCGTDWSCTTPTVTILTTASARASALIPPMCNVGNPGGDPQAGPYVDDIALAVQDNQSNNCTQGTDTNDSTGAGNHYNLWGCDFQSSFQGFVMNGTTCGLLATMNLSGYSGGAFLDEMVHHNGHVYTNERNNLGVVTARETLPAHWPLWSMDDIVVNWTASPPAVVQTCSANSGAAGAPGTGSLPCIAYYNTGAALWAASSTVVSGTSPRITNNCEAYAKMDSLLDLPNGLPNGVRFFFAANQSTNSTTTPNLLKYSAQVAPLTGPPVTPGVSTLTCALLGADSYAQDVFFYADSLGNYTGIMTPANQTQLYPSPSALAVDANGYWIPYMEYPMIWPDGVRFYGTGTTMERPEWVETCYVTASCKNNYVMDEFDALLTTGPAPTYTMAFAAMQIRSNILSPGSTACNQMLKSYGGTTCGPAAPSMKSGGCGHSSFDVKTGWLICDGSSTALDEFGNAKSVLMSSKFQNELLALNSLQNGVFTRSGKTSLQ